MPACSATRATASSDAASRMQPVGLLGEQMTMALVAGVMQARSASSSIWNCAGSVSKKTALAWLATTMLSYRPKAGVGMMTSSPGLSIAMNAADRASVAPSVRMTSSAENERPASPM